MKSPGRMPGDETTVFVRWVRVAPAGAGGLATRSKAAAESALGRRLAVDLLAQLAEVPRAEVLISQICGRCGGEHGKPQVVSPEGWHVSVSHTHGLVAVAATIVGPVGLDVEDRTHETDTDLQQWVRREALLKATGQGLVDADEPGTGLLADAADPTDVTDAANKLPTFRAALLETARRLEAQTLPAYRPREPHVVRDLRIHGCVAAVAVLTDMPWEALAYEVRPD